MSDKQKKAIDDIMELFNLGGTEKEEQSSDYSNTADADNGSKPSFDELVDGIGDSLGDTDATPALPVAKKEEVKEEPKPQPVAKEEPKPEPKPEPKVEAPAPKVEESATDVPVVTDDEDEVNINADDIFAESGSTKEEPKAEGSNVVEEVSVSDAEVEGQKETFDTVETNAELTPERTVEQSKTEDAPKGSTPFDLPTDHASEEPTPEQPKPSATVVRVKNNVKLVNGEVSWLLKAPAEKYVSFYEDKAETLDYLLPSGHIPFQKYKNELRDARVDLEVRTHDTEEIYNRMKLVQNHKERLNEISLHVNEQYYVWDRFIEMMRGQLARIDQEKNAERRSGVVFQHMRDFEFYYADLKFLHNQISLVMKNLDSAWETLNRKVTIALSNLKEPDRYQSPQKGIVSNVQPTKQVASPAKPEPKSTPMSDIDMLGDFDGIEGPSVEVPKQQKGSREVDW